MIALKPQHRLTTVVVKNMIVGNLGDLMKDLMHRFFSSSFRDFLASVLQHKHMMVFENIIYFYLAYLIIKRLYIILHIFIYGIRFKFILRCSNFLKAIFKIYR